MASEHSFWFRVGYALERAKQPAPASGKKLSTLEARAKPKRPAPRSGKDGGAGDDLVTAAIVALAGRLLAAWRPGRRPGPIRLLHAALAGGGAALLLDLVRPLLVGRPESPTLGGDTAGRVLAGVGQGLVYGSVVEPRVPGPALLKGALFGSAEYAADPAGGLGHLLGAHTPQGRLPVVGHLLEGIDVHDRAYLEHLVFGVALAVLYGSSRSSNGMRPDDDDGGLKLLRGPSHVVGGTDAQADLPGRRFPLGAPVRR